MKNDKYSVEVEIIEHVSGTMEIASFKIGDIFIADITNDSRMTPPWCARSSSGCFDGWKHSEWRFDTKELAIEKIINHIGGNKIPDTLIAIEIDRNYPIDE